MITYKPSTFEEQLNTYIAYAATTRLIDTFWENQIVNSDIFAIYDDEKAIGVFSLMVDDGHKKLTSFFLSPQNVDKAQDIFMEIITEYKPHCAYVVTNDELFLSLCMDRQTKVECQAYFFDAEEEPQQKAEYPASFLHKATAGDVAELEKLDFFYSLDLDDENDIKYVLRDGNSLLGAGHIAAMRLAPKFSACGMVTSPDFRQKGVGRSIIIHLKKIAQANGKIPIAGCWYYNTNSKKTLLSSGFTSKTRYLKVSF